MENQESSNPRTSGIFSLIFLIGGIICVSFFAASSLFFLKKGHMPSYYISDAASVSDFSIVDNTMNFKLTGYPNDYTIEFNEPPAIQKTDKLKVELNSNQGYIQVYVNEKLTYDKSSDMTFTEIARNPDTGKVVYSVIKNIKVDSTKKLQSP
jgi:hypothetical protein